MASFIMFGLAVLYRLGPSRDGARWRWVSWGAVTTTVLWLIGSALFSYYVSRFSSYDRMYGSLAAVIVLMLWLELSAFLIILGAQLNAELEQRTV
ncbi:MAG: YihY/virulence factor BrkB family protein [Pseudomonadota bacterium]